MFLCLTLLIASGCGDDEHVPVCGDGLVEGDEQCDDGDNIANNDSFLICFEAVLLNEVGNQASPPPLTNIGNLVVGTDIFTDTLDLAIVEPTLQIAKSVDDPNPTPGQVVTFTMVVDHAPSSGTDAFDVEISDSLPADLTLDPASISLSPSGGLVNVVNGSAGNMIFVSVDDFPIGCSRRWTYDSTKPNERTGFASGGLERNA